MKNKKYTSQFRPTGNPFFNWNNLYPVKNWLSFNDGIISRSTANIYIA